MRVLTDKQSRAPQFCTRFGAYYCVTYCRELGLSGAVLVLLISGLPQTRRSWNKLIPLLSQNFNTLATDLPSFGDSGIPIYSIFEVL